MQTSAGPMRASRSWPARTVGTIVHMAVSDYGSFREALDKYLGNLPEAGAIRAAILAVSGPVQNGRCALTNNPWVIDAADLRGAYGFSTVRLINDFEAVAWSLPHLSRDKLLQVGGGQPVVGAPRRGAWSWYRPWNGLQHTARNWSPRAFERGRPFDNGRHLVAGGCRDRLSAATFWTCLGRTRSFRHWAGKSSRSSRCAGPCDAAKTPLLPRSLRPESRVTVRRAALPSTCFARCLGLSPAISRSRSVRGAEYLLVEAFCVTCPNISPAPHFGARFEDKGRFSKYLEPIPAYLILDEDAAFVGLRALAEVEGIG